MKRGSVFFLKIAIIIIGMIGLALCISRAFWLTNNSVSPAYAHILYPIVTGIYVSAIPFYILLYKVYKLLCYIDVNKVFTQTFINNLRTIKNCATAFGILYVIVMPFVYLLADKDDAPGLIIFGMFPIFTSALVVFFTANSQRILQKAIDIRFKE